MSREICPDCVNTPCQCFENELKKLSDDMTLSADPLGRIKDLQSRLTAAETRARKLEELLLRAIHFIDPSCLSTEGWYHTNTSMAEHLTAELDKLKGTE